MSIRAVDPKWKEGEPIVLAYFCDHPACGARGPNSYCNPMLPLKGWKSEQWHGEQQKDFCPEHG